jgi:hypothetical protein
MGSRLGTLKVAAKRIGMSFDEYMDKLNAGLKRCWKCGRWLPADRFCLDATRGDGRDPRCDQCRQTGTGPTNYTRRKKAQIGLHWCASCENWVPLDQVSNSKCRSCINATDRARYQTDERYRRERQQHAHSRKRSVDPIPPQGQDLLLDYFDGQCAYCGKAATTWDHIVPVSKGGQTVPWNIVPACVSCNSSKKTSDVFAWLDSKSLKGSPLIAERMILQFILPPV